MIGNKRKGGVIMTQVQEAAVRHQCGQEPRDHLQHLHHQKELLKQQGFSGQRKGKNGDTKGGYVSQVVCLLCR